jgi:hypothetical protein
LPVSGALGTNVFTSSDSWFAEEDDGVGHFLRAVNVFNTGPPEALGTNVFTSSFLPLVFTYNFSIVVVRHGYFQKSDI